MTENARILREVQDRERAWRQALRKEYGLPPDPED